MYRHRFLFRVANKKAIILVRKTNCQDDSFVWMWYELLTRTLANQVLFEHVNVCSVVILWKNLYIVSVNMELSQYWTCPWRYPELGIFSWEAYYNVWSSELICNCVSFILVDKSCNSISNPLNAINFAWLCMLTWSVQLIGSIMMNIYPFVELCSAYNVNKCTF